MDPKKWCKQPQRSQENYHSQRKLFFVELGRGWWEKERKKSIMEMHTIGTSGFDLGALLLKEL